MAPLSEPDDALLIGRLFTEEDRLPRGVIDQILREGERLAPGLVEILDEEALWADPGPRGWAPVHATFLLASMKPPDALDPVIRALERAEEHGVEVLLEAAPSLLAALAGPALEPLQTLLLDRARPLRLRVDAAMGLLAAGRSHPELRDRAESMVRAAAADPGEGGDFRLGCASLLLDLGDPRDRALLLSFGKNDIFDPEYVNEVFDAGVQAPPFEIEDWLAFYDPGEIEARQSERAQDEGAPPPEEGMDDLDPDEIVPPDAAADLIEAASADPDVPPLPFRREEPKVGRNDPCPCGSGAKFKKCCGR
jgi:hypothetical protein